MSWSASDCGLRSKSSPLTAAPSRPPTRRPAALCSRFACRFRRKKKAMDKSKIAILVVDDERGLCAGVQEALRREGYAVDAANDGGTALKFVGDRLYNLVLTDVKMPEMSGLQLLKEAKQKSHDTLFILMTAYGTVESAVAAM